MMQRPAAKSAENCAIVVANAAGSASADSASDGADCTVHPTPSKPTTASKPRIYYVDWLRVFLTLVVVLHHCVTTYQSSAPWKAKQGDTTLWLLSQLFVYANQAYFMTLFFFISGLYVPASLKRKGAGRFLLDRTLRLIIPCLIYSLVLAPFTIWWGSQAAADLKPNSPTLSYRQAYQSWLAPSWPTTYNLATGPLWFVLMLWAFNVAYVLISPVVEAIARIWARYRHQKFSSQLDQESQMPKSPDNTATKGLAGNYYTTRQCFIGGAALIIGLTAPCYAVRMLDALVYNIQPGQFYQQGPFLSFMPDYFVVYVIAFTLGTFSGPKAWNLLARLPKGWALPLLFVAGIWWMQLGFIVNTVLNTMMKLTPQGVQAYCLAWLLRTFVEQSFCVVWSAGLLVLFREAFNCKPNKLGALIIGSAYGVYIIHYPIIQLYARAFMMIAARTFPSSVVSSAVISCPVVISAWLVAAALKAAPNADRVL